MSPKAKTEFVCAACGQAAPAWSGRCPACGEWNTMEEALRAPAKPAAAAHGMRPQSLEAFDADCERRVATGIGEFDRVLGGGIVPGELTLLSGDPGIGKSTLLLQMCAHLPDNLRVLYVSGEESGRQISLRAQRLGVRGGNVRLLCETQLEAVLGAMDEERPDVVIVDSIQTMQLSLLSSSPGSVSQVRECAAALQRKAKDSEIPVFLVGHVTKEGAIAGPKVMEHIVDCVLYFEGDTQSSYRLLRCAKNRFGATSEIGVFEMNDRGLAEVENPSLALLSGRPENVSGSCVACTAEGSRPLLTEVQGLVSPTAFGNPRRMSTGFDYNRLSLLLAVLEKRAGYFFSTLDAYVNVVGGLTLSEPAADLPVALALISSLKDKPLPAHAVAFGEIGLAGELRAVPRTDMRVAEAARLGFTLAVVPRHNVHKIAPAPGIEIVGAASVREAYEWLT